MSLTIIHVQKFMIPIDRKCQIVARSMSPTVSSQGCGHRTLVMLLYLAKYVWGIVQYVQT